MPVVDDGTSLEESEVMSDTGAGACQIWTVGIDDVTLTPPLVN